MVLLSQRVLILSPQSWNHIFISKHHYAIALAESNTVVYVNPPRTGLFSLSWYTMKERGVTVLNYNVPLPEWSKFKLPWLFKPLVKWQLRRVLGSLYGSFDLCIDFGCYLLWDNVKFIAATKKVFFPVDDTSEIDGSLRGCQMALTVSSVVQQKFRTDSCHLLNHGLSDPFVKLAREEVASGVQWKRKDRLRIGYSGNLLLRFIDFDAFREVITENREIEFHLFGDYNFDKRDSAGAKWVEFLKTSPNVVLHGWLQPERLAEMFKKMDAFLILYKPDDRYYHGDNSHKLLEYMSTGKVIIGSGVSLYHHADLIAVISDERFDLSFKQVMRDLEYWNRLEEMQSRRRFAMENSYRNQLKRIEQFLQ